MAAIVRGVESTKNCSKETAFPICAVEPGKLESQRKAMARPGAMPFYGNAATQASYYPLRTSVDEIGISEGLDRKSVV